MIEIINEHKVKTEFFEGPVSILLNMIELKKLDITELSLSEISDEYLNAIKATPEFPAEQAAQFIYVASILLLIKSKVLLPLLSLSDEDHSDIEVLKLKLKALQILRSKTKGVFLNLNTKKRVLVSAVRVEEEVKFSTGKGLTPANMRKFVASATEGMVKRENRYNVNVKSTIKLEDVMEMIEELLKKVQAINFTDVAVKTTKKDFIVSFLALLELTRIGICRANQDDEFSDILISREENI